MVFSSLNVCNQENSGECTKFIFPRELQTLCQETVKYFDTYSKVNTRVLNNQMNVMQSRETDMFSLPFAYRYIKVCLSVRELDDTSVTQLYEMSSSRHLLQSKRCHSPSSMKSHFRRTVYSFQKTKLTQRKKNLPNIILTSKWKIKKITLGSQDWQSLIQVQGKDREVEDRSVFKANFIKVCLLHKCAFVILREVYFCTRTPGRKSISFNFLNVQVAITLPAKATYKKITRFLLKCKEEINLNTG